MLSRAVCAPRICLSCRLGLARQRASIAQRHPLQLLNNIADGRRYKSKSSKNAEDKLVVQSKERIESLLRGDTTLEDEKKAAPNKTQPAKDSTPTIQQIAKALVDQPVEFEEQPDVSFMDPKVQRRQSKTKPYEPYYKKSERERKAKSEENADFRPNWSRYWAEEENHGGQGKPEGSGEWQTRTASNGTSERSPRANGRRRSLISHRKLDIDALGKPVDALVLENPNRLSSGTSSPLYMPVGDSTQVDWAALGTFETSEDTAADADQNIEEMRPVDNGAITLKSFQKLRAGLVESYTKDQLYLYIQARQAHKRTPQQKQELLPWLKRERPWKSETASDTVHLTPKARLATTILKDIWGVDVLEDLMEVGLHTISLKDSLFKLVAQPTTGAMKYVTAGLLDKSNGETIKLDHSESELYIQSRKSTIPTMKSRIGDVANAMARKKIRLTKVEAAGVDQAVLDELGRITKAAVHFTSNAPEDIEIIYLTRDPSQPAHDDIISPGRFKSESFETKADIVRRLLSTREKRYHEEQTKVVLSSTSQELCTHVRHQGEIRSLSWRNRMRSWTRLVAPIGKSTPDQEPPEIKLTVPEPDISRPGLEGKRHFTASFGHILHESVDVTTSKDGPQNARHFALSPIVPHPAAFTDMLSDSEQTVRRQVFILLNFAPSRQHAGQAPEVKLRLPVDPEDDFSSFTMPETASLYAVQPQLRQLVMLPEASTDVRLTMDKTLDMDLADQRHVRRFFADSEFNLTEGRLQTPSKVGIFLPREWSTFSGGEDKKTLVDYTFAGLEIHQTVDLGWKGHTLKYSSIEAGQHGGTRQELSLEAAVPEDALAIDEVVQGFTRQVAQIALGEVFPWAGGHALVREIPEETDEQAVEEDLEEITGEAVETEEHDLLVNNCEEAIEIGSELVSTADYLVSSAQRLLSNLPTENDAAIEPEEQASSGIHNETGASPDSGKHLISSIMEALTSHMSSEIPR